MTALILSRLAALNLPSLRNGTAAGPCGKVATICGGMLMTCAERIPVDPHSCGCVHVMLHVRRAR
jgi:hypothetical protein